MIYPESFDEKSGFAVIRSLVAGYCICELGREHTRQMSFLTSFDDISLRLRQTDELRRIHLFGQELPLGHITDSTPGLRKLRVEGAFMDTGELFDLRRSLDTAKGILNYFSGKNAGLYPVLASLSEGSAVPAFVREKLSSLLTREGQIKDNASSELQAVRRSITQKQAAVSKKLHAVLREAQSGGLVEGDVSIAIRNGRPVIPVSSSLKRRIPGFVHDESASGRTAYIEPSVVVELNNEIRELEYAERREVMRILKEVAGSIRPYLEELLGVFRFLGLIDFIRAKAMFAVKIGAVMPVFRDRPWLKWKDALHPLLYLALKRENRETVPLDIELDDQNRILVISGPNAGGKSVCLQTVGLLQYMLQCGLLIPVSENSETGLFTGIFIDIGDEQSIENDLSTYSSHLMNMKYFLRHSGPRTLVLIDEFGTGTEPMLGGAIAESILGSLNSSGTYGVITTHYTNLKHFAASTPGITNGAMLFDTGKMEPLFRLETGKPGSSFAFEIARKIGLPEEILKAAAGKIGEKHIDFDRHLKDIIRDKHYWDRKRKNIRQLEKKLESDLERYGSQLADAEKEQKQIIARARDEARQLLEGVNKTIENTIREIRETQAEKERTRAAREKLAGLKQQVEDSDAHTDTESKIGQLRARQQKLQGSRPKGSEKAAGSESKAEQDDAQLKKGDYVTHVDRDIAGEVLDVNGKSIMVAFGNMVTTVDEKKLRKLSRNEAKKIVRASAPGDRSSMFDLRDKKLNFRAEQDVRGMRADEALDRVSLFIDDALMVGAREVRILHGKGNGILRQLIREYLGSIQLVKAFRDEHVESGGSGITVVELES
jgi:DNA mismatch repair protein MutS2